MRGRDSIEPKMLDRFKSTIITGVIIGLFFTCFAAGGEKNQKPKVKDLPDHWRVWIEEEVYPLITDEQKKAFLRLETESQRKAFVERLWMLWGRQSGFGSAFRQHYRERLEFARIQFEYMTEDRTRVFLIHGPPDFVLVSQCSEIFVPLEIWVWGYIEGLGEDVVALFYRPGGLSFFRMWSVLSSESRLYTFSAWNEKMLGYASRFDSPEFQCMDGDTIMGLIRSAASWSRDPNYMAAMFKMRSRDRHDPESASERFMEFSALLDEDAEALEFRIEDSARGLRGGLVQKGFELKLSRNDLGTTDVGEVKVAQVNVVGEITHEGNMVDRFRYLFSVPAAGEELSFLFERFIRPGEYSLRLKVEDAHSQRASIKEFQFRADSRDVVDAGAFTGAKNGIEAPLELGDEVLKLVGPGGEAVSGIHHFEVLAAEQVSRIIYLIDGREILAKNRPPFDVDLDLGAFPRLTTVTAAAYGATGSELDRKEITLNVARERFYLRLQRPRIVKGAQVKVSLVLNIPTEASLDRVELYWNERVLTTLYQEPFEAWVTLDRKDTYGYLRAMAVLSDGAKAEDILFVNAPQFGSIVDVTSIELPVSVRDSAGDPVIDLNAENFTVYEDGVKQKVSHCSLHRDLPVRMGIVIDTSGSMKQSLPEVQRVVMVFLRKLLRPRDRAYIETFSDQPDILAPFTAEFSTLENALLALYADRSTSLHDAIIMGLFQFSGVHGRKAMVVLSDGEDTASKNDFDSVINYAYRSGVMIYTIGMDLPATKIRARRRLSRIAEVTGGRAFFLSGDSELADVYSEIDMELRTLYLLAFTSNSTKKAEELREIKVKVDQRRLKVHTISGYFPEG